LEIAHLFDEAFGAEHESAFRLRAEVVIDEDRHELVAEGSTPLRFQGRLGTTTRSRALKARRPLAKSSIIQALETSPRNVRASASEVASCEGTTTTKSSDSPTTVAPDDPAKRRDSRPSVAQPPSRRRAGMILSARTGPGPHTLRSLLPCP